MLPGVEACEGEEPEEGSHEDEAENHQAGLQENQAWVGLERKVNSSVWSPSLIVQVSEYSTWM